MASTIAFAPHQSSPLARTTSPFKDARAPPSTPRDTAKIWDEYERRAVENARRRETTCTTSSSSLQGSSRRISNGTVMDIIRSYDPHSSPRLLQGSPTLGSDPAFPTTVATCKTCKEPITSASGICAKCKKTIVFARSSEDGPHHYHQPHPPPSLLLRPTTPEQHCTDDASQPKKSTSAPPSPKRKSLAPPIRLSSLHPPDPLRPRKSSLTDPNDPFLRLQTARPPASTSASVCISHGRRICVETWHADDDDDDDDNAPYRVDSTLALSVHLYAYVCSPSAAPQRHALGTLGAVAVLFAHHHHG
ncbi:hypothetical protein BS50DRAFT_637759 [Corynespora cassiicola Philippines]|uniref:Uncharacterized protein n=1 Tax=Corynespora cassiicola Philippines TaxID=1448308 RepID=A0A2T2NCY3_CORCC|nr:hypothetical protein BS50DRAFT_637759 [Corynespora cassiicola Philippines]